MNKEALLLYQQADKLKNLNKNAEAISVFFEILKLEPNSPQIFEEIARLYEKEGNALKSAKYFALCLKSSHKTDEMATKLSQAHFEMLRQTEHFTVRGEHKKAAVLLKEISADAAFLDARSANTLLNCAEIILGKTELLSSPKILVIEPTGKCNFNCIMCGKTDDTAHELSARQKDEIKNLLLYAENAAWAGGEPFLYPYMLELLETAHTCGVEQTITTNASLLTDSIVKNLAAWNVKVIVSIDAPVKEVYENIRRGASFEVLIQKLELLKKYKEQFPSFNTEICFVVMEENYKYMEQTLDLAAKYKFNAVIFNPRDFKPENFSKEMIDYINQNKAALYEKAASYAIDLRGWLGKNLSPPAHNFEKKQSASASGELIKTLKAEIEKLLPKNISDKNIPCTLPWTSFFLHSQTGAAPNCYCPKLEKDWNKYNSVKQMWNSPVFVSYRQNMLTGNGSLCSSECNTNLIPDYYKKR
jgi:MoaA/NifB/PqqE/SkfB family radical SAM enzyme